MKGVLEETVEKHESVIEALARWGLIKFLEDAIDAYVKRALDREGFFTKAIEERLTKVFNEELGRIQEIVKSDYAKLTREQSAMKRFTAIHNKTLETFAEHIAKELTGKTVKKKAKIKK